MLHGRAASSLFKTRIAITKYTSYESLTLRKFSSRASRLPSASPLLLNSQRKCIDRRPLYFPRLVSQHRHQSSYFNNSVPNPATFPTTPELDAELPVEQPWTESTTVSEPYIGYLKDFGIDFGWGPSSVMQWVFEHIHVLAGTPMWGSVILLAIFYRAAIFRLLLMSSDNSARMNALQPVTKPIMDQMKDAAARGDKIATQKFRLELSQAYKTADVKFRRMAYPLLQIPFGFGVWRLLKSMATVPVPELATGGVLWFPNLILPDPYFFLPCVLGASIFIQSRIGGQNASVNPSPGLMFTLKWILPIMAPFVVSYAPAIIQLSFAVNAVLGFLTAMILRHPSFRKVFKLAPMVNTTSPTQKPSVGLVKGIKTQGFSGYFRAQRAKLATSGIMTQATKKAKENDQVHRRKVETARIMRAEQSRKDYENNIQNQMARRRQKHLDQ